MTESVAGTPRVRAPDLPEDDGEHPYSPAVEAGGVVFASGALSVDASGRPVPGRALALEAAMDRLRDRLHTVGADLRDVIKLTYYVTDVTLRGEANEHFRKVFSAPRPARTFVEVRRLPYGATVEIDAVARSQGERVVSDPQPG